MHTPELDILTHLQQWLDDGEEPWLCTIVDTIGSAPRPKGTLLAYCAGRAVGTLSGGCVEEDLLVKLDAGLIPGTAPHRVEYGVTAEENEKLGLPCGGRLELLVERLDRAQGVWVSEAIDAITARGLLERRLALSTGISQTARVDEFSPLALDEQQMVQCFGPKMRMLLVGAGQLAQVLASLALAMDFEVLVTDPRDSTLSQWQGPDVERIHGLPDDVIAERGSDPHCVIITLTHDPRIDDMALLEALETSAWYVGALGSVRTTQTRLERLRRLGVSDDQLTRLHAPVGLPIGSKTPWEIAVAIMAEVTQLRRQSHSS